MSKEKKIKEEKKDTKPAAKSIPATRDDLAYAANTDEDKEEKSELETQPETKGWPAQAGHGALAKDDVSDTDKVDFIHRTYGWSEQRKSYVCIEVAREQTGKSDKEGKPEYADVRRERLLQNDVYEFNTKAKLGKFEKVVFADGNPKNYLFANLKISA